MSTFRPLIVILGPTASGKTEMGLRLAKEYNGEIVNADSRQIYREMDIGTGKTDSQPWREGFSPKRLITKTNSPIGLKPLLPIHLINIKNPNQNFSLSQYKKLAIKTIKDIHQRGKIPILVGGTGLYISAIVDNLEIPKVAPNKEIRRKLEKHTEKYLFNKLKKVDLKSAKIIGEKNKRKLIRALEVYEITGRPFSAQQTKGKKLYDVLQIGIKIDREKLYKKIDKRVDQMIEIGLIEETKKLRNKYSSDLPAMSGIGYLEIGEYLGGKIDLDDAVQKIKYRTHQYARRQMTWFKRDERIKWVENYREAKKLVRDFAGHKQQSH